MSAYVPTQAEAEATAIDNLVDPALKTIMNNISFSSNPNDITDLSALPYLSSTAADPFTPSAIQNAILAVESPIPPTSKPPVDAAILANVTATITNALAAPTLTLKNVSDAFFKAGAGGFIFLLCKRINAQTGQSVTPTTVIDPAIGQTTLESLMVTIKSAIVASGVMSSEGDMADPNDNKNAAIIAASQAQIMNVASTAILQALNKKDLYNYLFDVDTLNALFLIALGPWLQLEQILAFATSSRTGFVTKEYAKTAAAQAASVAVAKLAAMNVAGSTTQAALTRVSIAILGLADKSGADYDPQILAVVQASQQNQADSRAVSMSSNSLVKRVGRTQDMQTAFTLDARDVRAKRYAFYAWLVAYIVVVAVSVLLIVTDRLSAFMALAGATVTIVTLYLLSKLFFS